MMNTKRRFAIILFMTNFILAYTLGDLENTDYTKCGKYNYPVFINGIEDLVETSDPLSVNLITWNLLDVKYLLKRATLTGMKHCTVTTLMIYKSKLSFQYNLECPHLEGNAEYNATGHVAAMFLERKGILKFTCDDCLIMLDGNYEKNIGKDDKQHIVIKNYDIDFNARGRLQVNLTNAFEDDKEKFVKLSNENWKYIKEQSRAPVLKAYMDVFIEHLNKFLQLVSVDKGCVLE